MFTLRVCEHYFNYIQLTAKRQVFLKKLIFHRHFVFLKLTPRVIPNDLPVICPVFMLQQTGRENQQQAGRDRAPPLQTKGM